MNDNVATSQRPLDNRDVNITKEDITAKTAALAKQNRISKEQYEEYLGDVRESVEKK